MRITKPSYFDSFGCLASACPDSCCKEWDVQVDAKTADLYRSLPGALGDRLRQVMYTEEGEVYLAIEDRRCPMWQEDGLCRIQTELGHDALCKTCREFPRLTHDYGDFMEMGLELSCPEAARLILSAGNEPPVTEKVPGGEPPEYDADAMAVLLRSREIALAILRDEAYAPNEALVQLLYYGYQAQGELDGEPAEEFTPADLGAMDFPAGDISGLLAFFQTLEILTPQWQTRLSSPAQPGPWQESFRNLARYFVERYWLQAVSDYDLVCRVKLAVVSCLAIHLLGGNLAETAQVYSKEIENSANNVDALLDAAYTCPAFTDQNLLGLLLNP